MARTDRNPIVLVHGYSDQGDSFRTWKEALCKLDYDPQTIHVCNYKTLTNEVTIADLAEGFDRALRARPGLEDGQPFDAMVHSTGMLVLRAWLTKYTKRRDRLKHLIAIAPATFGSPLAHTGRSWLGSIFKGNKGFGPDFLEAGDLVLDSLELASRFTWDLAHEDLVGTETFYGPDAATPYVFVFCGNKSYDGYRKLVNQPGTDGTVRWAGCQLNTRKIVMDLTREAPQDQGASRFQIPEWKNEEMPFTLVPGLNHGTILVEPTPELIGLVDSALGVSNREELRGWIDSSRPLHARAAEKLPRWQQFVVHATDERGDPITDFHLEVFTRVGEKDQRKDQTLDGFEMDVYQYSTDPSFRCFHVDLDTLPLEKVDALFLRATASSGSRLVGYHGFGSYPDERDLSEIDPKGGWDVEIEITPLLKGEDNIKFFYPYTTTLVELRFDREPLPIKPGLPLEVCWWK